MIYLIRYEDILELWFLAEHLAASTVPCKGIFYSQLTLPCRDVFRATIANGTSLHKEYTVLVDYAIVSSVEKEADKTDLWDGELIRRKIRCSKIENEQSSSSLIRTLLTY